MLKMQHLNLNGLELDGTTPITPRTKEFLIYKGIQAKQKDGYVMVTGSFSINPAEVAEFLASKGSAPAPKGIQAEQKDGSLVNNGNFSINTYEFLASKKSAPAPKP